MIHNSTNDTTYTIQRLVEQAQASCEADDGELAVYIAQELLKRSRELQTPQERRQQAELDRMIGQPTDKATLVEMTDQAFRTLTPSRVADQLTHILDLQGVPRFFSPLERTMLRGFQSFGEYLPGVAVPLVKDKMRRETANVILPAETEMLTEHLRQRQREGVRMNVNFLGEALLGEGEARRRLDKYLAAIRLPEVECVSVKITTIFSQVNGIAREHSIRIIADRMELLYRAASRETFKLADGSETTKFVYLDMEEYRDLHLTKEAMCRALERDGLKEVRAGIALQAYLPDSYDVMQQLIAWSKQRIAEGGVPLTIRLVKGANMEMERVEAAIGGWEQAPYLTKTETDANYKRMLRALVSTDSEVFTGVASHNLFDISLAMLWAYRAGSLDRVQFEMLEGMANHQRRAIFETTRSMLLYAPACRREEFLNAIGYLIRRLDENTGKENFLRHTFQLRAGSDEWKSLAQGFKNALQHVDTVGDKPQRTQDRRQTPTAPAQAAHWSEYIGEADTDWSVPHHAEWAQDLVDTWQKKCDDEAESVPLFIAGEEQSAAGRDEQESIDPSRPGVVACRFLEADEQDIDRAVDCADADPTGWRKTTLAYRHALLREAAQLMRIRRAELIAAAIADGGKTVAEADPEVSEAIDFIEFYPLTVAALEERKSIACKPRGVVAVVSPWNFPLAIPCGGVAAALAAGNTVILKPASDTVLAAYKIVKCFWDAGVPKKVLQLTPAAGSRGGARLVADKRVQTVVLTGGTSTARRMLTARPGLHLIAETGGKNATIVTALSDRDLAIKNVLHSAFGHCGQKCSATSLLLLEDEVYENETFRETLADAVHSLTVGSAWDLSTRIGPMIRPPGGELARGMKELEPGESWLVMPERLSANQQLYRPGVKWNVLPGGFTHRTELFGPVLGVMRFRRLEDAIGIVNATGYGLTSGLESLDDREQQLWKQTIRAGNLYINRPTTGAIVLRQPFGGVGNSAYGPGVKAGGPHYVLPLMHVQNGLHAGNMASEMESSRDMQIMSELAQTWTEDKVVDDDQATKMRNSLVSLRIATETEFSQEHDSLKILGQDNLRRYRQVSHVRLRIDSDARLSDVFIAISSAIAVGSNLTISHGDWDLSDKPTRLLYACITEIADRLPGKVEVLEETDNELASAIREGSVDRLRMLDPKTRTPAINDACCDAFVSVIEEPVVADGLAEGLRYVNEQSLSYNYHRYGNLGRRKAP